MSELENSVTLTVDGLDYGGWKNVGLKPMGNVRNCRRLISWLLVDCSRATSTKFCTKPKGPLCREWDSREFAI